MQSRKQENGQLATDIWKVVSAKTWYQRPACGLQGGNPSSRDAESQKNEKALKDASDSIILAASSSGVGGGEDNSQDNSHTLTEKSASASVFGFEDGH